MAEDFKVVEPEKSPSFPFEIAWNLNATLLMICASECVNIRRVYDLAGLTINAVFIHVRMIDDFMQSGNF